jgi:hypothetical protein
MDNHVINFIPLNFMDDNNCNPPNLELRTNSKLAIIEFTIKEISDILKSLNIKKASGHDLISHHISFSVSKSDGIVQLRPTLPISFLTRDQNNLGFDEFSSRKSFELRKKLLLCMDNHVINFIKI